MANPIETAQAAIAANIALHTTSQDTLAANVALHTTSQDTQATNIATLAANLALHTTSQDTQATNIDTIATNLALHTTSQDTLAANLALHTTSLDALTTQVTALVAAQVALSLPQGVPVGSTPFSAMNQAAADTAATPVVVYANPGATRLFITQARLYNETTAEIAAGAIQGDGDVPLVYLGTSSFDGMAIAADRGVHNFSPPLIIPAGEDIEWVPFATVGDVWCAVVGYIEP